MTISKRNHEPREELTPVALQLFGNSGTGRVGSVWRRPANLATRFKGRQVDRRVFHV
jgi:hypothetical protein